MIGLISKTNISAPLSVAQLSELPQDADEQKINSATFPVIEHLGNQGRFDGDSANPACVICWAACLANPATAPICPLLCAAMCVPPFADQV